MTIFLAILLGLVFIALHVLIGGVHLAFALPAYALLGITALLSLALFRRQRSGADPYCLLSAIALSFYIQGRALLSPNPFFADREWLLAQVCLIVYLLVSLVITKPRDRLLVVGMLGVLALGNVAVGLHQFAKDNDFTFWGIGRYTYGWRASGFLICPNHIASFYSIILLMAGAILLWGRIGATRRVALVGFCAFTTMGLATTGSRGGALGLAGGALVLIVISICVWRSYYMWRWWKTLMICAGIGMVALGGLMFVQRLPMAQQIVGRFHNIPGDLDWRVTAWKLGLDQFKTAPVAGAGAGTFVVYGRSHRPMTKQVDLVHVHNDYIELLSEYGIIGGVLLVVCLALHARRWWISFRYLAFQRLQGTGGGGSNALALNLGALTAIVAVMISAMFDFNMQIPGVAAVAAFAFAVMGSPGPVERRTRIRSSAKAGPEVPLVAVDPERSEAELPRSEPETVWGGWVTDGSRILAAVLALVLIGWAVRYWYPEYMGYRGRLILVKDGDIPDGIDYLQKAVPWNPRNHQPFFYLAEAQRQFADASPDPAVRESLYHKAEANFLLSLKRFPENDRSLWGLAKVYDRFGRWKESEALWKQLMQLDPLQSRIRLHHGQHFYAMGRYAAAIREYEVAAYLDSSLQGIPQFIEQARAQMAARGQAAPPAPAAVPSAPKERVSDETGNKDGE